MARKHKPEEIIGKLREAEIVLAQGGTVADACRRIGVTEQSYYRWRKEYGGLKMDHIRTLMPVSERRVCRVLGQHRLTQRKTPRGADDEAALTEDIIALARQYGRYGYRRVTAWRCR